MINHKDELIQMALRELGVPTPEYPDPIANAVEFLKEALATDDSEVLRQYHELCKVELDESVDR